MKQLGKGWMEVESRCHIPEIRLELSPEPCRGVRPVKAKGCRKDGTLAIKTFQK